MHFPEQLMLLPWKLFGLKALRRNTDTFSSFPAVKQYLLWRVFKIPTDINTLTKRPPLQQPDFRKEM